MTYKTKNTRGGVILLAIGSIKPGESARLANAIQRVGPRLAEIWLYALGGTSVEGIKMGRLIRKKGLATRIPKGAMCFSACSMVFLGGVLRMVDAGGYYGVHMWTQFGQEGSEQILSAILKDVQAVQTKKMKAEVLINNVKSLLQSIEQRNADYARNRANYLIEMSISLRLMIPNVQTKAGGQH